MEQQQQQQLVRRWCFSFDWLINNNNDEDDDGDDNNNNVTIIYLLLFASSAMLSLELMYSVPRINVFSAQRCKNKSFSDKMCFNPQTLYIDLKLIYFIFSTQSFLLDELWETHPVADGPYLLGNMKLKYS